MPNQSQMDHTELRENILVTRCDEHFSFSLSGDCLVHQGRSNLTWSRWWSKDCWGAINGFICQNYLNFQLASFCCTKVLGFWQILWTSGHYLRSKNKHGRIDSKGWQPDMAWHGMACFYLIVSHVKTSSRGLPEKLNKWLVNWQVRCETLSILTVRLFYSILNLSNLVKARDTWEPVVFPLTIEHNLGRIFF